MRSFGGQFGGGAWVWGHVHWEKGNEEGHPSFLSPPPPRAGRSRKVPEGIRFLGHFKAHKPLDLRAPSALLRKRAGAGGLVRRDARVLRARGPQGGRAGLCSKGRAGHRGRPRAGAERSQGMCKRLGEAVSSGCKCGWGWSARGTRHKRPWHEATAVGGVVRQRAEDLGARNTRPPGTCAGGRGVGQRAGVRVVGMPCPRREGGMARGAGGLTLPHL